MSMERQAMDLEAYTERARNGPCFVCAFLAGDPDYSHHTVYEDEDQKSLLFRIRADRLPRSVAHPSRQGPRCAQGAH